MHSWGDGFKYFGDVSRAADEIGDFCRKWGRINVAQTKEKYGTARVYCTLGLTDLHGLLYPGYAYVRGPYWLMTLPIFRYLPTRWWQRRVYRLAYARALKKYPHIREEILDCADWPEYLEGL